MLAGARRAVVFTGSGVSAESGVPTFRGAGGLWREYRAEDLATPGAFARNPRLVWEWYAWRRDLVMRCAPNAAHLALARWMAASEAVTLITQNVDDLHERACEQGGAAVPPTRLIRLHGSLFEVRCTGCGWSGGYRGPISAESEVTLPQCDRCGGLLRPGVVWFGEELPEDALNRAIAVAGSSEACLVVGTSGAVYPAAGVVHAAAAAGAAIVVVDPGETAFDGIAAVKLSGRAAEVLPGILPL